MKIPNSIRIGGIDYPVKYVSGLNDGKEMLCGQIDYGACVIKLNPEECEDSQFTGEVLWHEIIHGIAEHANLAIKDKEKVIDTLAKGIYQVLQDNARKLYDITDGKPVNSEDKT